MLKDILQQILNDLNSNILDKKNYLKYLTELESYINIIFEKFNYNLKEEKDNYFIQNLKKENIQRLDILKEKKIETNNNDGLYISENVNFWSEKFDEFLNIYNIGYLRSFNLNHRGIFEIEINGMINCMNKKISKIKDFENSLNRLKNFGFDLEKNKNNYYYLIANDNNMNKIKELFESIGSKIIRITTRNNQIETYNFLINPKNINLLETKIYKIEKTSFEINNYLNPDELYNLKKLCKDMNVEYFMNEDLNTDVCFCLCSYFYEMCEIFDVTNEITKQYDENKKESKNVNLEINNLLQNFNKISVENITKTAETINDNFKKKLISTISFNGDLFFEKYNNITFNANYYASDFYDFFMDDEDTNFLISEEKLKNTFNMFGKSKKNENLFIMDTPKNKKNLIKIISTEIPSIDIMKIESKSDFNGNWYISNISGRINNIKDLL